ncbi:DUF3159 domain-containing protein [Rhodococcus sp. X156]|uniref:DUF3159 domain-containing protein n=1 Tax=Rhodococcus sp. X156 TaxID=2499145 RepID=UPI000FDC28D4|nr:DUF3159 domain-containing protein [Rhodococcus sp. X156]
MTSPVQKTLLEQMGGTSGVLASSLPVVVFVVVNSLTSLTPAIWSAVGTAAAIAVLRAVRKEGVQPAISGLFGVAIAAYIAHRTGTAKGYFLLGIYTSLVYGALFALSVLVRWPLVGVVWSFLNGHGWAWRAHRGAVRAYDVATLAWVAVFGARFVVQQWLYGNDQEGWLATARIGMGLPLYGLALLVTFACVRRADRIIEAGTPPVAPAPPEPPGQPSAGPQQRD